MFNKGRTPLQEQMSMRSRRLLLNLLSRDMFIELREQEKEMKENRLAVVKSSISTKSSGCGANQGYCDGLFPLWTRQSENKVLDELTIEKIPKGIPSSSGTIFFSGITGDREFLKSFNLYYEELFKIRKGGRGTKHCRQAFSKESF